MSNHYKQSEVMKCKPILATLVATLSLALGSTSLEAQTSPQTYDATKGEFVLIALPYAPSALAPVISEQTILLHHGKHLQGYVNNLNKLKRGTAFEHISDLESIVRQSKGALFDNAGQLLNHNLYFTQFAPKGVAPSGRLLELIEGQWGSFKAFQDAFEVEGTRLFGSGWLWLAQDASGELVITREPNGSNPVAQGLTPLLGIDLWEHAYYLDYQNKRADHVRALWPIIDWQVVAGRLK